MPNLPILRRADCGHFIPANSRPSGTDHTLGRELYLCADCKGALKKRPKIERKA